ncbi:MAG: amidophosphoribosyltransferase [Candidatus ainarchaeum sp.]|nr:amidophosphoribosyltransferase [Candidatus ainarchaeum sp.]
MKEECGVCAFFGKNAEEKIYLMLIQLQHRGQLSAGMTTFNSNEKHLLKTHRGLGLVNSSFKAYDENKFKQILIKHHSNKGIGHVRYSTSGQDDLEYVQPFEREHGRKKKWFSFAFNGSITNYSELKKDLEANGYHLIRETDTEIIQHLISRFLKEEPNNLQNVFHNLAKKIDGSYSLVFINAEGTIIALRDPLGIKPLCYAEKNGEIGIASESVALANIGFDKIKEVPPGKIIEIDNKLELKDFLINNKRAFCMFEWVYFAHAASKIEEKLVYNVRYNLGKELAKLEKEKIDKNCVVVPVPDSSKPAGDGFAEELGLPSKEGLVRNRYLGRTFIETKNRGSKVRQKFSIAKEVFENKKVFLVDDSIVRGNTMKNLIGYIKEYGNPKEIHVRVSCPEVMFPCFYGVDMGSKKEFIANNKLTRNERIEAIRKEINVDSLIYQSIENLVKVIGIDEKNLCLACLNGKYPTKKGEELKNFDDNKIE